MPDDQPTSGTLPDFIQKHLASFVKHSAWAALTVIILWSFRSDFMLPMMGSLKDMADTMRALERGQDRLLYHTVHGSWRSTEPPDDAPSVPEPPPAETSRPEEP